MASAEHPHRYRCRSRARPEEAWISESSCLNSTWLEIFKKSAFQNRPVELKQLESKLLYDERKYIFFPKSIQQLNSEDSYIGVRPRLNIE